MGKEEQLLQKIKELSNEANKENLESLKSLLWIVFENESKQHDLYYISKILSLPQIIDLVEFYDGSQMKIPSKKEFRESLALVVALHLDMNGYTWEEIKNLLDLKDKSYYNSLMIGKKMKSIKENIKQKIYKVLNKKTKEVEELARSIFK
jgi:hypothetical protein